VSGQDGVLQETPLHLACKTGNLAAVQYLLSREDLKPAPRDRKGQTPLYLAIPGGCLVLMIWRRA
jgi:ankyrin repeat protein